MVSLPSTIARVALLLVFVLGFAVAWGIARESHDATHAQVKARDVYITIPATGDAPAMAMWVAAELDEPTRAVANPAVLKMRPSTEPTGAPAAMRTP
jgi:hypothetical protein